MSFTVAELQAMLAAATAAEATTAASRVVVAAPAARAAAAPAPPAPAGGALTPAFERWALGGRRFFLEKNKAIPLGGIPGDGAIKGAAFHYADRFRPGEDDASAASGSGGDPSAPPARPALLACLGNVIALNAAIAALSKRLTVAHDEKEWKRRWANLISRLRRGHKGRPSCPSEHDAILCALETALTGKPPYESPSARRRGGGG